jgi:hypothetical protein
LHWWPSWNQDCAVQPFRPSPHLDTKSRNMCIWSCSVTVAIQSLEFISRNSDVAIQNLQVSCLPLKTDNLIHVAQHYVVSTCSETDRPTIHTVLFFALSCTKFSMETTLKLIEDFKQVRVYGMLHPWNIKTEIKGEMPCTNLQSNTGYQIRRWKKKS